MLFCKNYLLVNETLVHHCNPLMKRQPMEWHHQLPRKTKFKVQTCAGKVIAGIFWGSEGLLLVEFLESNAIINSEQYVQTLKKFRQGM
jgi:hypothetical protein